MRGSPADHQVLSLVVTVDHWGGAGDKGASQPAAAAVAATQLRIPAARCHRGTDELENVEELQRQVRGDSSDSAALHVTRCLRYILQQILATHTQQQ